MINLIDVKNKTINLDMVVDSFPDGTSVKVIESNDEDALIICVSIFRHSKKIEINNILSWCHLAQRKDPEGLIFFVFHRLKRELEKDIRSAGIVKTGSES